MTYPDCGCRIRYIRKLREPDEVDGIVYCPLHEAAPKLLALLRGFLEAGYNRELAQQAVDEATKGGGDVAKRPAER